jgi:hypothetical protein
VPVGIRKQGTGSEAGLFNLETGKTLQPNRKPVIFLTGFEGTPRQNFQPRPAGYFYFYHEEDRGANLKKFI